MTVLVEVALNTEVVFFTGRDNCGFGGGGVNLVRADEALLRRVGAVRESTGLGEATTTGTERESDSVSKLEQVDNLISRADRVHGLARILWMSS